LLDEVGEMSLTMQPKLLRVLQNRTFRRVGGNRDIDLKARVVSATNRKLSAERQDGMRSDLYFRLAGFTIVLPPLRHRPEDIDLLANHFLLDFAAKYPGVPTRISAAAAELMLSYPWRGNVRELKRVVEQAAVLCSGSVLGDDAVARTLDERHGVPQARLGADGRESASGIMPAVNPRSAELGPVTTSWTRSHDALVPANLHASSSTSSSGLRALGLPDDVGLNAIQQRLILDAYEANSRNLSRAARALRIPRTTLRDRLKRYGCL
jgi:DNA-binding NtrC family response regulator